MPQSIVFDIVDEMTVTENLAAYQVALGQIDPVLSPILGGMLLSLLETPECEKGAMLDAFKAALDLLEIGVEGQGVAS
jgi:hypothetical protein